MIGVLLLIHGNAVDAGCVNAFATGVVPQVVDPGDAIEFCDFFAGLGIENVELCGITRAPEQAVICLVQRQSRDEMRNRPGGNLLALVAVQHAKFVVPEQGYENPWSRAFDLDSARQCKRENVSNMLVSCGVNDRKAA